MSYVRLASVLILLVASCDKSSDSSKESAKDKEKDKDGVSVGKYCEKMMSLDEKTAAANSKGGKSKPEPGEPSRDDLVGFCKMMFSNAKSEEPKAYACMADCMMSAETREEEQTCVTEKKCLGKAKNKKLFSNRTD